MRIFLTSLFWMVSSVGLAAEHVVTQKGKAFDKTELSIAVGDKVKFLNEDDTAHHLMYKIGGEKFSHKQKSGDTAGTAVVQEFAAAGDVTVRCAIHPKMKLKIKVQ